MFLALIVVGGFPSLAYGNSNGSQLDFGLIHGDVSNVARATYSFVNEGSNTLKIKRIITSCGCIASDLSSQEIAPRASKDIEFKINVGQAKIGSFSSSSIIEFTDPSVKPKMISIKALVSRKCAASPSTLDLGSVPLGEPIKVKIQILGTLLDDLSKGKFLITDRDVSLLSAKSLGEDYLTPNCKHYKWEVELLISSIVSGVNSLKLELEYNGEIYPLSTIRCVAVEPIRFTPSELSFGFIDSGESLQKDVAFSSVEHKAIVVKSLMVDNSSFVIKESSTADGKLYISISFKPNAVGRHRGTLSVVLIDGTTAKCKLSGTAF
jgi:hypothetical protein